MREIAIQKEKIEEEINKQKTGEGGGGGVEVGHQRKASRGKLIRRVDTDPSLARPNPSKEWEKHVRRCQIIKGNSEKGERRREESGRCGNSGDGGVPQG